jgi:hypothetical protein
MRLSLEADQAGDTIVVRLVASAGDEAVVFNRQALIGPNLSGPIGAFPPSLEPGFEDPRQDEVALNPGTFYGRERRFPQLPAGEYEFTGKLVGDDPGVVELDAEPLRLRVG